LLEVTRVPVGGPGVDGEAGRLLHLDQHLERHVEGVAGVIVDAQPGRAEEGDVVERRAAVRVGVLDDAICLTAREPDRGREQERPVTSDGEVQLRERSHPLGEHRRERGGGRVEQHVDRLRAGVPSVSTPMKVS
jgi:hypothetical protein